MRAFVVALVCSSAVLGQAALADPAVTQNPAPPASSAQPVAPSTTTATPAQPAAVAPSPAATVAADSAPAAVPAQTAESGANLDEIVCKQEAPATGTRLGGGRECHTVRQWNEREREAQDITRKQQVVGIALSK